MITATLMDAIVADRLKAARTLALWKQVRLEWKKMVERFESIGWALLCSLVLTVGWAPEPRAATSAPLDIPQNDLAGVPIGRMEVGNPKPLTGQNRDGSKPSLNGNPLWSLPLSVLTATQERPIFSASRRPPPSAVIAPPVDQVKALVPQKAAQPEQLPLALIGAVVGDSDAIAVFFDRTNQKIVRLRQGETHAGWVLSSVLRREVTLRKADRTQVLALQRPDVPAGVPGAPGVPGLTIPSAGGVDVSYAPFIPRSTPKNGESDGL
jgi:general secretion pathway protein N